MIFERRFTLTSTTHFPTTQITAIYPQHEQNRKRLHISINSEKSHQSTQKAVL